MLRTWSAAILLLSVAACRQPVKEMKKAARAAAGGEPQIQATVVTIQTVVQPENKTTTSTIVIANDLARAAYETGIWRLYDLKQNRVAFVDEFAKTVRYESLRALQRRREDAADNIVNERLPVASISSTPARQNILGVEASQSIVRLGAYQREIWFGRHPLIPPQLFALMHASEAPGGDAPVARAVDRALMNAQGFPLREHSELPYANVKLTVDRTVVNVQQKNVDASLLRIPDDYREVMPQPMPVARPRRVLTPKPPEPEPPPIITETTATTATTTTTATAPATATDTTATAMATATETTGTTATAAKVETKKAAPVVKKASTTKKKAPVVKKAPTSKKAPVVKKTPTTKKKAPAKKPATTKKTKKS